MILLDGWTSHQDASLLLDDPAIIEEFHGFLVLSVFPHEGEEPDAALADAEVGGREGHFRV